MHNSKQKCESQCFCINQVGYLAHAEKNFRVIWYITSGYFAKHTKNIFKLSKL